MPSPLATDFVQKFTADLQPWQKEVLAALQSGRLHLQRHLQRRLLEIGPEFFTGPEPVISCAVSSATARRDGHPSFEPDSQRTPPHAAAGKPSVCVGLGETPAAKARLENSFP